MTITSFFLCVYALGVVIGDILEFFIETEITWCAYVCAHVYVRLCACVYACMHTRACMHVNLETGRVKNGQSHFQYDYRV